MMIQLIALCAYIFCAFRIVYFSRDGSRYHRGYAWFATLLAASFFGQSIHIIFFKDPVTIWDAVFAVVLAVIVHRSGGNVAKLIWSAS